MILYVCHTHRIYSTKNEPLSKLLTLGDCDVSGHFILGKHCAILVSDVDKSHACVGTEDI